MPKTAKLLLTGILPLFIGILFHGLLMVLPLPGILYILLEIAFVFGWGWLVYRIADPNINPMVQGSLLMAFGLIMLILAVYQELAVGRYWANLAGLASQMYFMAFLILAGLLVDPFVETLRAWPLYIGIWTIMLVIACAACWRKQHPRPDKTEEHWLDG